MRFVFLFLCLIFTSAEASWNEQHELGWHWYQDPEKITEKMKKPHTSPQQQIDPLQEIATEKEKLERLRAEAILRPTESSVKEYIEKQIWASNQADRFSQVWDAVMRQNPGLDYSVKYPTAQFARHIYLDQQKIKVNQSIEAFKQNYGFFFFFKSDCPYCHSMAPIIKEVSERHGILVTAISIDSGTLKEYPSPLLDNGISSRLSVHSVPAVFAINPLKDEWFPIVTGPISAADLEERILAIAEYASFAEKEKNDEVSHNP